MLSGLFFLLYFLCIAIQCGFIFYFFFRIFWLPKVNPICNPKDPVSVIVCAHNEARNLETNLPGILEQEYKDQSGKGLFEVIVVNDASEDDTEQILFNLEQKYAHLWHVSIASETPRLFKGKKFALSQGIEHASHEKLLLTDADCKPDSKKWISQMMASLQGSKEIVAGYSGFYYQPGILNSFIRWETMHTFLQYASYTLAGHPYMAVGRNLACLKSTFLKAQQSENWNKLPSGDDDLLIANCGNNQNTTINSEPNAFTHSEAKSCFKDWLKQKQRHVSTGKYYKPGIKFLLSLYGFSHGFAWLLFFILIFSGYWIWASWAFLFRSGIFWFIQGFTCLKLKDKKTLWWIPLCDLGWAVYNFVLSPYIIWKNKKQWK